MRFFDWMDIEDGEMRHFWVNFDYQMYNINEYFI